MDDKHLQAVAKSLGQRITPSTQTAPTEEQLNHICEQHARWLDSRGNNGACAGLIGADLRSFELRDRRLAGADLRWANLAGVDISGADLEGAQLHSAQLERVTARGTNFTKANMHGADLSFAILERANLSHCILAEAKLENANFGFADLPRANLRGADLGTAVLEGTDLSRADLRDRPDHLKASWIRRFLNRWLGTNPAPFRLDRTTCIGTIFPQYSDDRWSILRRAYTGPRFVLLLLLSVAAFLPMIFQAIFWLHVNDIEEHLITIERQLKQQVSDVEVKPSVKKIIEKVPKAKSWMSSWTELVSKEKAATRRVPIGLLLLGWERGWIAVLFSVCILVQNIAQGLLTRSVFPLREEEDRTGVTPAWSEYRRWWGFHRVARAISPIATFVLWWRILTVVATPVLLLR
jgi:Pentapeptide repeats (8 copies)